MMAAIRLLLLCVMLAVFVGCAGYRATYNIGLSTVERPANAKVHYGEQRVTALSDSGKQKWLFEDGLVQVLWFPTSTEFSFVLANKTDHTVKIIWDEAAYVDANGASHRVIHHGVKYVEKNNSQPPSVIVRNGSLSDLVMPVDNVEFINMPGLYTGWHETPLFPSYDKNAARLMAEAEACKGKTVQVLLPIVIEGTVNEYIFIFEVADVQVK